MAPPYEPPRQRPWIIRKQNRMIAALKPICIEGRDQPDRPGAQSHADERQDERIFAADAVSHPAEHERPQRTNQESGGEQRDRAEQGGNGVALFEEFDRQDCGQAPENIEVIPLDDVSRGCGSDHGPEVLRNSSRLSHSHLSHVIFLLWCRRNKFHRGNPSGFHASSCPPAFQLLAAAQFVPRGRVPT